MKNFDFIQLLAQHIPSFSKLHAYCDKAEIFQNSYPEESATNARKALEVLQICPLEHILVETDSPYLSPVPMRGKRNDPGNLPWICAKIAEVKGLSTEEVARITAENGCRLFGCI